MTLFTAFLLLFAMDIIILGGIMYLVIVVLDLPGKLLRKRLSQLRSEDLDRRSTYEQLHIKKRIHGQDQS